MKAIRLTDDEIVAVSVEAQGAWASVVPTVDLSNQSDLARAAERGIRSFVVRQLVDEGQPGRVPSRQVAELVAPAIASIPVLMAWTADLEDPYQSSGTTLAVFTAADEGRLVVVSSPVGIHDISCIAADECGRVVQSFVAGGSTVATITVARPTTPTAGRFAVIAGDDSKTGTYDLGVFSDDDEIVPGILAGVC